MDSVRSRGDNELSDERRQNRGVARVGRDLLSAQRLCGAIDGPHTDRILHEDSQENN